ncbi:MAG: arsenic efflux protein [Bacteroidetes bacterium]|nr:arsenic efflux protein [Bacteroidota bacterium]
MILEVLKHAILITSFVFVMMLLIEYINVQTHGSWQNNLKKSRFGQYALGIILGAIPGCLGAFTIVSLYSHGVVSFGALVATMIATSGDEAYVMLSLFPTKALLLIFILSIVGFTAGYLVDKIYAKQEKLLEKLGHSLQLHEDELLDCYPKGYILKQLKEITFERVLLLSVLSLFLILILLGTIEPYEWNWVRITLLAGTLFGLFVVLTVPDHFLEKHLWEHVLKKHLLRIFLWTFGALLVIHILDNYIDVEAWIQANMYFVLIIAVLIGIIPESGPHLIFVTLFASGTIPFGILLASSIAQDGHGALPLLAVSNRGFITLKVINIIVGFGIGLAAILFGF